jgi:hypothetical protein
MVRVRPVVWWAERGEWVPLADMEYRAPAAAVPAGLVAPAPAQWVPGASTRQQRAYEDVPFAFMVNQCGQWSRSDNESYYNEEGCRQGRSVSI